MELEEAKKGLKRFCEYEDSIVLTDNALYEIQEMVETVLKELESWKNYVCELEDEIIEKNNKICELEFKIEDCNKIIEQLNVTLDEEE